jgi:hypothetical protein
MASIMDLYDMKGTFYINTGRLDRRLYMTSNDINQMYEEGHEIGGNTLTYTDLSNVTVHLARDEICINRARLINYKPVSFSYPFNNYNKNIERLILFCGYNSSLVGCASCDITNIRHPMPVNTTHMYQLYSITYDDLDNAEQLINSVDKGRWIILNFKEYSFFKIFRFYFLIRWLYKNDIPIRRVRDVLKSNINSIPKEYTRYIEDNSSILDSKKKIIVGGSVVGYIILLFIIFGCRRLKN